MGARSGKTLTTFQRGMFCAWDGEGLTMKGRHAYVLLCSSAGDRLWRSGGVGTLEALATITARARALDRRTVHVVFGGSYDMNCWLRELTPFQLTQVWQGKRVTLYSSDERPRALFRVEYRPRRSLVVWDVEHDSRVTVWDVWGFFQGSFVGALEKYGLPVPAHLRTMKAARSSFTLAQRRAVTRYCAQECDLLVTLMTLTRDYLAQAELPVRRWDGAGACAVALLTRERVKDHLTVGPDQVRRAARYAYAGGRIELVRYGHAPRTPLHHYDVCSAYPAAIRGCPSLARGAWRTRTLSGGSVWRERDAFMLVHVEYNFTDTRSGVLPFFWRSPTGAIFYPWRGAGWYWLPEVAAACEALEAGAIEGTVRLGRSYAWEPAGAPVYPFAFVDQAYAQRRTWKAAGVGAEKALKLAMNSLYGKTAQHSGARGKAPAFHQLEYAGYITSVTRAQMFRAACLAGPDLVGLATDAIFSTRPLEQLEQGSALGQWEYHAHQGSTFVQSGVYWLDEPDGTVTAFSRGFDKGSLNRRAIVQAWKRGAESWDASLTRFVTMGAVVAGQEPASAWRQWKRAPRVLALNPSGTKRRDDRTTVNALGPAYGFIRTLPSVPAAQLVSDDRGGFPLSTIYPLAWEHDPAFAPDRDGAYWQTVEWDAQETEGDA
jgi:hypothetical protein